MRLLISLSLVGLLFGCEHKDEKDTIKIKAEEGSTVIINQGGSNDGNSVNQSDTSGNSNFDREQTDTDVFVTNMTEKAAIEAWERYKKAYGIVE